MINLADKNTLLMLAAKIETYGEFADVLREMRREGWTRPSIQYVLDQVLPPARTSEPALGRITRLTVVTDRGVAYEDYNAYDSGVTFNIQDAGRTLKIFPA